ncbi:MAG: hypothetical protein LIO85_02525 [Rikenellaceae bacterium]|nr:hypothetical protein [Rikenellaceae bacterium]
MRTVICSLIFLLSGVLAYPQDFDAQVERCLGYFTRGETEPFEATYPGLYTEYLKEVIPAYRDALLAVKEGDTGRALSHLSEQLDPDLFLDELATDSNFIRLHVLPEWHELMRRYEAVKAGYNNEVRLRLKAIQAKDQGIRLLYLNTGDGPVKDKMHEYMHEVDAESAAEVCAILDLYGWLGPDEIGEEANETLFLAVQHVGDADIQQKYLPMLAEAAADGRAEWWHFAFLTDRTLMNRGLKQIYGTQKILSRQPGKSYIVPLEHPERVDELRASVGLDPLAEELADYGMEWDLGEYLRNLPDIERMYRERYEALTGEHRKAVKED